VLIQVNHSARNSSRIQLFPEFYPRALVVIPGDAQKWWLMEFFDGRRTEEFRHPTSSAMTPAGRMRRVRRGSAYYQMQPLQRTTTMWEVGTGWVSEGARWVRFEVSSNSLSPRAVSVDIIPIYDCDRVSKISFNINDFDFRTRITTEESTNQVVEKVPETTPAVVRVSRYQRVPVI
jgi:hypothetical protein